MASNARKSPLLAVNFPPATPLTDILISKANWGKIMGKLRMDIKVALFLALAAMAEIIVNVKANPMLPTTKINNQKARFLTGLVNKSEKTR